MSFRINLLRRTCREAAALMVAREDRPLALPDRVALKFHLMACDACPRFENQILTLREAMGRWRNDTGEPASDRPAAATD